MFQEREQSKLEADTKVVGKFVENGAVISDEDDKSFKENCGDKDEKRIVLIVHE